MTSRNGSSPYRDSRLQQRIVVHWYIRQYGRRGIFNVPVGAVSGIVSALVCAYAHSPNFMLPMVMFAAWCITSLRRSTTPPNGAPVIWREERTVSDGR